MKQLLPVALALSVAGPALAQAPAASPYRTRLAVEAPVLAAEGLVAGFGLYRSFRRGGATPAELAALNRQDVPGFDRFSAGWYSERAQLAGDLLCYPSLALVPAGLALNPAIRSRCGQVLVLYAESVAAADALFLTAIGNAPRYRPYLYGSEGGELRTGHVATNSFFAGHTAHTAAAAFFAAKVFHDFHPGSRAQPYVWAGAALLPAVVAYTRVEAGKHFLSDNLVGYAVGATCGVLVPQLHKVAGRHGVSVQPWQGINVNGYAFSGVIVRKEL